MTPVRRVRVGAAGLLVVGATSATGAQAVPVPRVAAPPPMPAAQVVTYRPPVALHVLRGFDPPAGGYGPGHLGVDLAAGQGDRVGAAAPGIVTFAGRVAGRSLVVLAHVDGVRTEYEPLRPAVRVGQAVVADEVLGTVRGRHRGCPAGCLHWGARRGDAYVDPLSLLRRLGPVRLLPWTGAVPGG